MLNSLCEYDISDEDKTRCIKYGGITRCPLNCHHSDDEDWITFDSVEKNEEKT